ncbi:hypothetical protein NsoK4_03640 [Nitrosopumilus sp. K4]|uniref:hypothetical protein n=1 Tax=Nitrosopumilus sp. K4 TaxID=2795383 RepID=UPI001BA7B834|nr:hypothetical protein [Nitrosopumilus sp. K4]QUC65348.1 hypothetical protein NsoK4_03640 [Nitrosopumilus sp. K4]
MGKLPKKFPEYAIMYKTLLKKITELESEISNQQDSQKNRELLEKYKVEIEKIRKMFPEDFFEELDRQISD